MKTIFSCIALALAGLILSNSAMAAKPKKAANSHHQANPYERTDYGKKIQGVHGNVAVWWCEAAWKIPRDRSVPKGVAAAATVSAARNDFEAFQVVVRPLTKSLCQLTATTSPLTGPQGAVIPAANIQVLREYYHNVQRPTDKTSMKGLWPDALPPLTQPIDVAAQHNQPLWVLIHVPSDAAPGDYSGVLELQASEWSAKVPIRLHVWNFALPEQNHLATAFGLKWENVVAYQRLAKATDAEKRRVLDMYFRCMADHRISPYDPAPLDPIRVKFLPNAKPPRAELDFSRFDAAMHEATERYHFTDFRLPVRGLGGGNFEHRNEPKLNGYGEQTPQYKAMFANYLKQLESHLREKGWLKMAYVYWFDEPTPKDYAFVKSGMERLKRNAPNLRTMLTEQPEDTLAGPIDIWCPVSYAYKHEAAQLRRAHGDQFWWYVCCGPKAPYCTLFIDHPATDLRVWLWQTWQRDILGVLIWQTTHWTSPVGYPDKDHPQNPYEDPMSYRSDYNIPDEKPYWGNGDGRLLYPPLSAFAAGDGSDKPILEPPVSCIRLEMLREGIEDYEFLWLLRDQIAKHRAKLKPQERRNCEALLKVPSSITSEATAYTTDPRPIYAWRAKLAEAIERLAK